MRIVSESNAVVDPVAVMVKLTGAAIAHTAVLAAIEDVTFAYITLQVALELVKQHHLARFALNTVLSCFQVETLYLSYFVRGVALGRYVGLEDQGCE